MYVRVYQRTSRRTSIRNGAQSVSTRPSATHAGSRTTTGPPLPNRAHWEKMSMLEFEEFLNSWNVREVFAKLASVFVKDMLVV